MVSRTAAYRAFGRLLLPMVRLALKAGLKSADLQEALRDALIRTAREQMPNANVSQLSVATGVHRKDISRRVAADEADRANDPSARSIRSLPSDERSMASQVFFSWLERVDRRPELVSLPVLADDTRQMSFTRVSREAISDVHPRSILDELLRLGVVEEQDGVVSLLAGGFVPTGATDDKLDIMIDNAFAMVGTGVDNVLQTRAPMLEQAIWGERVSAASCEALDRVARDAWTSTHKSLYQSLLDTPEAAPSERAYRIRIGMYAYAEPMPIQANAELPSGKSTP